ncbi:MAG: nitroreductase family protein [Candidatus Omnitrophica bacterium]|nr:nitroreductase family protein [Candidatus Omnitrophota bacterium]
MSSEKNKVINPVIEAINKRLSVRSYEPKPIARNVISTIIEAGNQAPFMSEKHGKPEDLIQPWRFVVVEDSEFKQKLVQATEPIRSRFIEGMKETVPEMHKQVMKFYKEIGEPKDMVYYSAPVILFVIGPAGSDISCALACENIMIAATSFGLGSCYVGFGAMVTDDADIVEALELTEDERIFGPIVLGYPKSYSSAPDTIRPNKKEPRIKWI